MKKLLPLLIVLIVAVSCKSGSQEKSTTDSTVNATQTVVITKALFLEKVMNYEKNPQEWVYLGEKPAVIDFYADWCGPCKMIAPYLEEIAAEQKDSLIVYKLDTEAEKELAALFGIQSIPSLLFIPMEGQPQMAQGAMPKEQLMELVNTICLGK